jgi:hypothetical protein
MPGLIKKAGELPGGRAITGSDEDTPRSNITAVCMTSRFKAVVDLEGLVNRNGDSKQSIKVPMTRFCVFVQWVNDFMQILCKAPSMGHICIQLVHQPTTKVVENKGKRE